MFGSGFSVVMMRFCPSAFISLYLKNVSARLFFAKARSMDALTASAVRSLPFENFTPSRILNVHVRWSSLIFQLSASHGCTFIFSSNFAKASPMP